MPKYKLVKPLFQGLYFEADTLNKDHIDEMNKHVDFTLVDSLDIELLKTVEEYADKHGNVFHGREQGIVGIPINWFDGLHLVPMHSTKITPAYEWLRMHGSRTNVTKGSIEDYLEEVPE